MIQKRGKFLLFSLLILLLWMPLIQEFTRFFKETPLKGAFVMPPKPTLTFDSLRSQLFQKEFEEFKNLHFGFRPFFVRLKNSLGYVLFHETGIEDQLEGEEGFIYSKGSIKRGLGLDYNGKKQNENTLYKINFLKEHLERQGKHLLVVMAPAKDIIVPENIPPRYKNIHKDSTDYADLIAGYNAYNIPYIDLCAWFKQLKGHTSYPLYTKTGFHWSMYGAMHAHDTLVRYIQQLYPSPMPKYTLAKVEISNAPRLSDADFEEPMNLMFKLHQASYVYPKLEMVASSLNNTRPKVIVIGDSYFWQLKDLNVFSSIFSDESRYWYYFSQSFPFAEGKAGSDIKDIDVVKELESADFVIIFGNTSTLDKFPYGVTDHYAAHFTPDVEGVVSEYLSTSPDWIKKADAMKGISKDSLIKKEAQRMCATGKFIHLKAFNNKFVCVDEGLGNIVVADKEKASSWETFFMVELENNTCILFNRSNRLFSADLGSDCSLAATREKAQPWEIFTLVKIDDTHVAFKAGNGKFLSVDEKTLRLFAKGNNIGKIEQFELVKK